MELSRAEGFRHNRRRLGNMRSDGLQDPLLVGSAMLCPKLNVGSIGCAGRIDIQYLARLRVDDRAVLFNGPLLIPPAVLLPEVDVGTIGSLAS